MYTRETPASKAAQAATPWREPGDISALATQRTFLIKEEMVLADWPVLPISTQNKNKEVTHDPSGFFLKGPVCLNKHLNKEQGKE